jgi:hypothetical protein
MHRAAALRRELSVRGQQIAAATGSAHDLTPGEIPSVIFGRDENRRHGKFWKFPSRLLRNICTNPAWARRLRKVHTASRKPSPATGRRWMELGYGNDSRQNGPFGDLPHPHYSWCIFQRHCLSATWVFVVIAKVFNL